MVIEQDDGRPNSESDDQEIYRHAYRDGFGDGRKAANERREKADDDDDQEDESEDEDNKGGKGDKDQRPPLYRRPMFWLIAGVGAAILIILIILFWLHERQYQSTDDAFVDAHIVRLSAQVSGQLTQVAGTDNRHVKAGMLLATIEADATQAQLAQARSQALQADAQIQQASAQVVSAEAKRAQATAAAIQPEAEARKAAADLQRYLNLRALDAAAVSATQIDQARAEAESSAGQAAAARRQVQDASAQILVARKQVKVAIAQKQGALAQIAATRVTYGHLDIRAPVSGQVVNRNVNIGSYVSPGTQLMAIVPDEMWITANFKETQITHMRIGQHVDIKVDAFPGIQFNGHVDSIQRGAGQAFALLPPQNATGNYVKVVQRVPVRILFDGPDPHRYAIGPGMSVVPTVKVR
jgi:membrane fusion protein (multidrug efflux system)